jgi:hypothetical protein
MNAGALAVVVVSGGSEMLEIDDIEPHCLHSSLA